MTTMSDAFKISSLKIGRMDVATTPESTHEQRVLTADLLEQNHFKPANCPPGEYELELSVQEGRLIWQVRPVTGEAQIPAIVQSFAAYRKTVKDYLEIVGMYNEAVRSSSPTQLEAIDMGRRGLHNEGAQMVQDRLADKIEIDHDTARRLFSIITTFYTGSIKTPRIA